MALNIRKVPLNTVGRHFGVGHPTVVVNSDIELSILCQEVHKIQNAASKGNCASINQYQELCIIPRKEASASSSTPAVSLAEPPQIPCTSTEPTCTAIASSH